MLSSGAARDRHPRYEAGRKGRWCPSGDREGAVCYPADAGEPDPSASRGSIPPSPRCIASRVKKDGRVGETQRYRRRTRRRTFITRAGTPCAGQRWPQGGIVTAVRWYLRFRLSAADVRDLRADDPVLGPEIRPTVGVGGPTGRRVSGHALVVRRNVRARRRQVGVPVSGDRRARPGGGCPTT